MNKKVVTSLVVVLIFLIPAVVAQSVSPISEGHDLVPISNWTASLVGIIAIALFCLIAVLFEKKLRKHHKKALFASLVLIVSAITIYFIATTIFINTVAETNGPVHWHADFEILRCGQEIDLVDPTGLSNKVGTPLLHEHNDNRIHVEGSVIHKSDMNLKNFFTVVGAELTKDSFTIPTNEGSVKLKSGDMCNGRPAQLQVFVYKVINAHTTQRTGFQVVQTKLENPEEYLYSPYINVPPGDCIIIELDEEKLTTNKICPTYQVALEKGDLTLI